MFYALLVKNIPEIYNDLSSLDSCWSYKSFWLHKFYRKWEGWTRKPDQQHKLSIQLTIIKRVAIVL